MHGKFVYQVIVCCDQDAQKIGPAATIKSWTRSNETSQCFMNLEVVHSGLSLLTSHRLPLYLFTFDPAMQWPINAAAGQANYSISTAFDQVSSSPSLQHFSTWASTAHVGHHAVCALPHALQEVQASATLRCKGCRSGHLCTLSWLYTF